MKKKILTPVLLLSLAGSAFATKPIMHLQKLQAAKTKKENKRSEGNFIRPGMGFSTDKDMVVDNICYAVKSIDKDGLKGILNLNEAYSFDKLKKSLNVRTKMNMGIGLFGGGFAMDYLKTMEDSKLSYSLNFLSYQTQKYGINLDRTNGKKGLTEDGEFLYDNGENPYFGLSCGDDVITSYQKGAMLVFGLNLKFHNHSDLNKFKLSIHAGFGNIFSFSNSVEKFAKANHVDGTVSINAYQVGGEPQKLNNVLSKDPKSGNYYNLKCSMKDMTSCLKTANGLLEYANNNFPNQYSFATEDDNTAAFGINFATKENIRKSLLIKPPESFVTPEVEKARTDLAEALKKNEYYKKHLNKILNGYPVALDDSYRKQLQAIDDKATSNVDLLLDNRYGGMQCYTDPDTCVKSAAKIESNLKPITDEEIESMMKPIEYMLTGAPSSPYYYNGESNKKLYGLDFVGSYALYGGDPLDSDYKSISSRFYCTINPGSGHPHPAYYNGTVSGSFPSYSGMLYYKDHQGSWHHNWQHIFSTSPYYFTPYKADDNGSK